MSGLLNFDSWELPLTDLGELVRYLQSVQSRRTPMTDGAALHQLSRQEGTFYQCDYERNGHGPQSWTCVLTFGDRIQQATGPTKKAAKNQASKLLKTIESPEPRPPSAMDLPLPTARLLEEPDLVDSDDQVPNPRWDNLTDKQKSTRLDDEMELYNEKGRIERELTRLRQELADEDWTIA